PALVALASVLLDGKNSEDIEEVYGLFSQAAALGDPLAIEILVLRGLKFDVNNQVNVQADTLLSQQASSKSLMAVCFKYGKIGATFILSFLLRQGLKYGLKQGVESLF
ncbi:MAG: hypothetical protein WCG04_00750, partial [Alphaproteobacteria bacterium]